MVNKRNILKFICGVLIGGLILFSFGANGKKYPDEAKSLVKIYTEDGYGTGVIIEKSQNEVLIASNLHVIDGWNENAYVELYDGSRVFGQQFGADMVYDVAFIYIPTSEFENENGEKYPVADVCSDYEISIKADDNKEDNAEDGGEGDAATEKTAKSETDDVNRGEDENIQGISEEAWIYNIFNGKYPAKYLGEMEKSLTYVYDLEKSMYMGSFKAGCLTEGMSGSPIFTKAGCIGILTAGNDEGTAAVTPISDILKCLGQ